MSGIAGYFCNKIREDISFHKMTEAMNHRIDCCFCDNVSNIFAASKDRFYATADIVVLCDGRIFNHKDVRKELESFGYEFKSDTNDIDSDMETIANAYLKWGERCVDKFNGQFALAIYDYKKLFLARDRMGEKPLYYYQGKDFIIFASEIKAILTQIETEPCIPDEFWAFEGCGEGKTLFRNIYELPRANYATFDKDNILRFTEYWQIRNNDYSISSEADLIDELRYLIADAVKIRMFDGIGLSLSGGLDSAVIACLGKPEKVFTCRFPLGPQFDEWHYASLLAKHIGATQYTVLPTAKDLQETLSDVIWHLDQPIGTASPFADFLIMKMAQQEGTKFILGGQGSDELFGGYGRYLLMLALHHNDEIHKIAQLDNYHSMAEYLKSGPLPPTGNADRYFKLMTRNKCQEPDRHAQTVKKHFFKGKSLIDAMGITDIQLGLPAEATMHDRSASAYGIENFSPFMDHRLVEFAFTLPPAMKIREYVTKYILRKAMRGIVPDEILDRKDKKGLVTPFAKWLSNDLKDWSDTLIASLIDRGVGANLEPLRGDFDRGRYTKVSLELWLRRFFD